MLWWWVPGLVLFGLVLLGLAMLPVLRRLPALARAGARLQERSAQAETLQMSVAHLQERLEQFQEQVSDVQERSAASRRSGHDH